jgi:hypothetical protein
LKREGGGQKRGSHVLSHLFGAEHAAAPTTLRAASPWQAHRQAYPGCGRHLQVCVSCSYIICAFFFLSMSRESCDNQSQFMFLSSRLFLRQEVDNRCSLIYMNNFLWPSWSDSETWVLVSESEVKKLGTVLAW